MKESKGVYVNKKDFKYGTLHREYQLYQNKVVNELEFGSNEVRLKDVGVQIHNKRDHLICTCRNISGLKRHHEARYLSTTNRNNFIYHQKSRSYTDIGVGSIKAFQKKKIKRIYLPETDDRGVGSSDLTEIVNSRKSKAQNQGSYYDHKRTSSKCVGGFIQNTKECVISAKVSPIVHTKSGCTSPANSPSIAEEKDTKNIEIGSNTIEKELVAATTQIEIDDIVEEPKVLEISSKPKSIIKNLSKPSGGVKKIIETSLTAPDKDDSEKKTRDMITERSFSSDSLVERVHNLEDASQVKSLEIENKLEREFRRVFGNKSKEKPTSSTEKQVSGDFKSASVLRRRFDYLRKNLGKKEESKKNVLPSKTPSRHSNSSLPSHRDASVTSDPPSLEGRSYSNTKPYRYNPSPSKMAPKTKEEISFKKSSYVNKRDENKQWYQANAIDSEYAQGVKGMFKLWGKKFNLDDSYRNDTTSSKQMSMYRTEQMPQTSGIKKIDDIPPGPSKPSIEQDDSVAKKEGRKFFFFKKKSKYKEKDVKEKVKEKDTFKSKKGVTTGRCEVRDGLVIKIGGAKTPPVTKRKIVENSVSSYEELIRKAWLMKYLTHADDSRPSVKVRWNNNTYATSSSTIFEIMGSVYKDTGVVFRSKSEMITDESSYYTKSSRAASRNVNFVQNVQAWMIPTILNQPVPKPREKRNDKNKKVRISDQKWIIDSSKAFSHKIETVLHSNNVARMNLPVSSDYLRIYIPKGFFSESSSENAELHHTSEEEVYKIVEYETLSCDSKREKTQQYADDNNCDDLEVTISVTDDNNKDSKILETVIKRPPMHRDVVIQGSDVFVPKRCDVISVGIITQRDAREIRKPILKIVEYISDDDSDDRSLPQKKCAFAESYLQDTSRYYENWPPIEFSSYASDSHLRCSSCNNSNHNFSHAGDGSMSCPNIYKDYLTATIVSPVDTSSCSQCCADDGKDRKKKGKFFKKKQKKEKDSKDPKKGNDFFKLLPKDSIEVFRKRKFYACSKSNWICPSNEPSIVASFDERGPLSIDFNTGIKPCNQPQLTRRRKSPKKHVSLPDCEMMTDLLNKSFQDTPTGILSTGKSCKKSTPQSPPVSLPRSPTSSNGSNDSCCRLSKPIPSPRSTHSKHSSQGSERQSCVTPPPGHYATCPPKKCPSGPEGLACPPSKCLSYKCPKRFAEPSRLRPPPCGLDPPCTPPKSPSSQRAPPSAPPPTKCPPTPKQPPPPHLPPCDTPPKRTATPQPPPPHLPPCDTPPKRTATPPSKPKCTHHCRPAEPHHHHSKPKEPPSPPHCPPPKPRCPPSPPHRRPSPPHCPPKPRCPQSPTSCRTPSPCPSPPRSPPKTRSPQSQTSCRSCRTPSPCSTPPRRTTPPCSPPKPRSPQSPKCCRTPSPCPTPPRRTTPPRKPSPPRCPPKPRSPHSPTCCRTPSPCPTPPRKCSPPRSASPIRCPPKPCPPKRPSPPPKAQCPSSACPTPPTPISISIRPSPRTPPKSPCCEKKKPPPPPKKKPCKTFPCNSIKKPPPPPKVPKSRSRSPPAVPRPQCSTAPCKPPSPRCSGCNTSPCIRQVHPVESQDFPWPTNNQVSNQSSIMHLKKINVKSCPVSTVALTQSPASAARGNCKPDCFHKSKATPPGVKVLPAPIFCPPPGSPPPCPPPAQSPPPCPSPPKRASPPRSPPCGSPPRSPPKSPPCPPPKSSPCPPPRPVYVCPSPPMSPPCPSPPPAPPAPCPPLCPHHPPPCPSPPRPPTPPHPPAQCPKTCATRSRISGIFLKKLPSKRKTCAPECKAWSQTSTCEREQHEVIRLNSREKITIKMQQDCASIEELRECKEAGVFDERRQAEDYGTGKKLRGTWCKPRCRDTFVNDVYTDSNINRVTTVTPAEAECTQDTNKTRSDSSIANTVEINFKLRVTQGEKTTELDIGNNDSDPPTELNTMKRKTSQEVFILKDGKKEKNVKIDDSPKNDINIRILIKNYKPKSDKKKIEKKKIDDEFSKKISEKFNTVSTGYSTGCPLQGSQVFSAHKATIDLTESVAKSKEELMQPDAIMTNENMMPKESIILNENKDIKEIKSILVKSKCTFEDDKAILEPNEKESPENTPTELSNEDKTNEVIVNRSSSVKAPAESVDKLEPQDNLEEKKVESHFTVTDTDEGDVTDLCNKTSDDPTDANEETLPKTSNDQTTDLNLKSSYECDTDLGTKTSGEPAIEIIAKGKKEKKELLKKVFENANFLKKPKNKRKLKDILKSILTSDSSDPEVMVVASNELVKDLMYPSLQPTFFKNSDSLNNYYVGDSNATSEKDSEIKPLYPTRGSSVCSVKDRDSDNSWSLEDSSQNNCVCSHIASRLKSKMCAGGGCCCRVPIEKKNQETVCDLNPDEDVCLVYKSTELVDAEVQNSKYCVSKTVNVALEEKMDLVESKPTVNKFDSKLLLLQEPKPNKQIKPELVEECKRIIECGTRTRHKNEVYDCTFKRLNRTTKLGISDDDKIVFLEQKSTSLKVKSSKESRKRIFGGMSRLREPADILQLYETKKAVLEIYTEKTESEDGEHLVAKLPKFVFDKESEIGKNYDEITSSSYKSVCRRNIVMMSVGR